MRVRSLAESGAWMPGVEVSRQLARPRRACLLLMCVPFLVFHGIATGQSETRLKLQVGEVRVLPVPNVARVAVGNGQIVNAVTTDEKEVILFARHDGSSSLHVWSGDGRLHRYLVEVAPDGQREIQSQLRKVLERLPNVRVSLVGDKLLVEGESISDADRERISALARQYPQLLDFTSQVGWDRMVLLDVQVIEVPRNRLRELGVQWNPSSRGGFNAGLVWDAGARSLAGRPADEDALMAPFPAARALGYFGVNALLSARINAMTKTGSAVVLAQPQLLARSGATAEFLAGGEVPYSTVDANGNTNTAFKPYGVSLRITPRIEHNQAVRSRIEVEVSSVDSSMSAPGGPALKTRRAATEFNVRSGQTLVLAGFLSREEARNEDKIPGLGSVPIIGRLFGSRRFQRNETELAIFVTPMVVPADQPDLARRIERGRAILKSAFPQPVLINVPVATSPGPSSSRRSGAGDGAWNPYGSVGSQWVEPESFKE
ncbi:MAG TPA: pilus assembly protein N-terminal domain-containing protein [Burkholderiaceae bacterium]|nr:pilus assembly protein N-terminal domain-containing protein [Burkholderiaceae bacterium]